MNEHWESHGLSGLSILFAAHNDAALGACLSERNRRMDGGGVGNLMTLDESMIIADLACELWTHQLFMSFFGRECFGLILSLSLSHRRPKARNRKGAVESLAYLLTNIKALPKMLALKKSIL